MYLIKIGKNRLMDWSLVDVRSTLPSQMLEKWLVGVTVQKRSSRKLGGLVKGSRLLASTPTVTASAFMGS
jgi:hypothetical protein